MRSSLLPRLAVALAATALSFTAAACGDDNTNTGCEVDGDCRGARVCIEGACVDGDPQPGVDPNPTPEPGPGGDCAGDLECTAETVCDNGSCGERACTGDPDCGPNRFCYSGLCRAAIACDDDAACGFFPGGFCDRGRCSPGCVIDGDCPDPQAQACFESACRDRCGGDGDCGRGEICDDGASVCVAAECTGVGTEDCPGGERCSNGRCEAFQACRVDGECAPEEFCRDGICEPRTRCVGDGMCPDAQQCLDGFCRAIEVCEVREDCSEGLDCVGGRCVPFVCRGAEDCGADEVCEEGVCSPPDDPVTVSQVIILTPAQAISDGTEIQFEAVALDANNNLLSGQTFAWSSDNAGVADIGADSGVAVGGNAAGQAGITATATGTQITSDPVTLSNAGALPLDIERVVVVDTETGQPIVGATVERGDETVETNAQGVAEFAPSNGAFDITVYEAGHNTVSIIGVQALDVLVPMEPLSGNATAGGFTGEMDFSQVNSNGDVNVGLAGASLDSELANFDLEGILGDAFSTRVNIPGVFDTTLPLPGGLVLDGVVFGFPLTIKDTYSASTSGGLKVAWSLGGKIEANEIIGLVMGGGNAGGLVRELLPFFENFDHNIQPLLVDALPRIEDTDDIDGDGNRAEQIPDYDAFPTVDLAPRVAQRLRTALTLPPLPAIGNPQDTFVVTVGGVLAPGIGFVPMGLNATSDESGDGTPEPVTLRTAPPHSGLSAAQYAVVALTFDPNDLNADFATGIDLPDNYSTIVWQGPSIPADLDMTQDFLNLPEGQWSDGDRLISLDEVEGADLFRVTFIGAEGSWEVWVPAGTGEIALPEPPEGAVDFTQGAVIQIDAFSTVGGLGLSGLVESNGSSIRGVSAVSEGFSRTVLE